jgi:hypothetical protein
VFLPKVLLGKSHAISPEDVVSFKIESTKNTKRIYDLLKSTNDFQILEELEFNFNSKDEYGKTLLDHAFEDKNVLITKYLLSKTR